MPSTKMGTYRNQPSISLSLVIPAFNEEISLQQLLPEVVKFCKERRWDLIVVNDGSTDGTAEVIGAVQD